MTVSRFGWPLVYGHAGLAVILAFVGAKFLLTDVVHIGVGISLPVVMTVAIAASLRRSRPREA